jgi:hypothetical protein
MLNNLTSPLTYIDGAGDADKALMVEEVTGELNLRFERLTMKTSSPVEGEALEEYKNYSNHNCGKNGNGTGANFCLYCRKPDHDKKKEAQNDHASNLCGNADRQNHESQAAVLTAKNNILTDGIRICDSGK